MISDLLCREIEDYASEIRRSTLLSRARAGRVTPAIVGRYLASIHYLLRQTPIHLTLASRLAAQHGHEELAGYFERKMKDEEAHDHWAASDRERLHERFGSPALQEPAPSMLALVDNTRTIIERDPTLYLAYILFAEYFTVVMGPEWVAALEERCGIPAQALSAVTQHVELDKAHVTAGCQEIDELVRDVRFHGPLRETLRSTMRHFSAFCDDLCRAA